MIVFNFELFRMADCTDEEKRACFDLVKFIIAMSEKSHCGGLLSLENELSHMSDSYFIMMLNLILDGTDFDAVESIGETLIYSNEFKGKRLLEALIIYIGVTSLQRGYFPRTLLSKIASLFGPLASEVISFVGKDDLLEPDLS